MKVNKVILGSTCHPFYLDFWPIVSKIWKEKFNIHPVLILIHDDENIKVLEEHGTVIYIKPVEGVPLNIQAQCCRYFFPRTEPETTWMISDIDMLPISKYYFIDSIKDISDDKFVNLNAHSVAANPACYNIAKGKTFIDVLKLPETFEEFLKQTKWWERGEMHRPGQDLVCFNWCTDEQYSNELILEYYKTIDSTKFVNPPRPGGYCARRVDRIAWNRWTHQQVIDEYVLDAHSVRPYSEFKNEIDTLVNLILNKKP
jgi:hypothetical protein